MNQSAFKAIADPNRRRILALLRMRTMTAGEIADHFNLAKSTLSGHFNILKAAGLIEEERRGNTIVYSLNLSVVEELMVAIMDMLGTDRPKQNYPEDDNGEDKLAK
jgi:ArsR family transcriptional regulator, arsenate/arsenite/antimonite-responsive transcriptional repressor